MISFTTPPPTPRVNWTHPRAVGLVSAFPFCYAAPIFSSATQVWLRDLARGSLITSNGHITQASDSPGVILDNSGSTVGFYLNGSLAAVYNQPQMTVSALVRTTNAGTIQIATRDGGGLGRAWQFRMDGGKLTYFAFLGGTPSGGTGAIAINDGKWHHVAATYNQVRMISYVDGVIDRNDAFTTAIDSTNYWVTVLCNNTGGEVFPGYLADVKYWSRALSQAEISAEMNDVWEIYRTKPRAWISFAGAPSGFTKLAGRGGLVTGLAERSGGLAG